MSIATPEFAALFEAYAPSVRRAVLGRCPDVDLADDVVAETFARAWEHRARFHERGPCSREAWLHGIAANVLGRMLRDRRVERRGLARVESWEPRPDADPAQDIIARAVAADARGDIHEAFAELNADQQRAVRMRVLDGAEYDDIARADGTSVVTTRARVSRGLRILAVRSGLVALVLMALIAVSAAAAAAVTKWWPRAEVVQVVAAKDLPTLPIMGVTTTQGALVDATLRSMPIGVAARRIEGSEALVGHPAVGDYTVQIPIASINIIPSIDARLLDTSTGMSLDTPDPVTGARVIVLAPDYTTVQRPEGWYMRMKLRVRATGPIGEVGMRCTHAAYAKGASVREAITQCEHLPGVNPELDLSPNAGGGGPGDVLLPDAGTPVDLTGTMGVALAIAISEVGLPTVAS